jgi:16S rRNA (adenine1518-N6/adenine1519-N6)-dimethyltransferase
MREGELRDLLARHGFRTAKSLGQNFLIDDEVPERIADAAGLTRDTHALEIGPGVGALTRHLCRRAGFVTAIELDKRLPDILAERLQSFDNYEIIRGDALRLDLAPLFGHAPRVLTDLRVCANLPYNITSPILAKLLETQLFSSITVMVQREFAQRLAAEPGTSEYGAFTVFARYHADARALFDVPPTAFVPRPAVTSTVVRFATHEPPPALAENGIDERRFFRVVRASFAQRRKTLVNALASGFTDLPKADIATAVSGCGFDERIRGETLGIQGFAAVSGAIARAAAAKSRENTM